MKFVVVGEDLYEYGALQLDAVFFLVEIGRLFEEFQRWGGEDLGLHGGHLQQEEPLVHAAKLGDDIGDIQQIEGADIVGVGRKDRFQFGAGVDIATKAQQVEG